MLPPQLARRTSVHLRTRSVSSPPSTVAFAALHPSASNTTSSSAVHTNSYSVTSPRSSPVAVARRARHSLETRSALSSRPIGNPSSSASHRTFCGTSPASLRGRFRERGSYSTRRSKQEDGHTQEHELSQREHRWNERLTTMRASIEKDPYTAVFGRPFKSFWETDAWKPITPPWMQPAYAAPSGDAAAPARVPSTPSSSTTRNGRGTRNTSRPAYAQSSSFSYSSTQKAGEEPRVSASSSTWNSVTNTTETYVFDPISGRMISQTPPASPSLQSRRHVTSGTSPESADQSGSGTAAGIAETHVSASLANSVEAIQKTLKLLAESNVTPSDQVQSMISELRLALDRVNAARTIAQPTSNPQRHAEIRDAVAKLDHYPNSPMGLQTSFDTEKQETLQKKRQGLAAEISARLVEVAESLDDYSKKPIGLEKSWIDEQKAITDSKQLPLEQEILSRLGEQPAIPDGYGVAPVGLQNSYRSERQATSENKRKSLAEEIIAKNIETILPDGYSQAPIGLQSSFSQERLDETAKGRLSLAEEIMAKNKEQYYPDGYSQIPTGLQSSFEQERTDAAQPGGQTLAEELQSRHLEQHVPDGYSQAAIGLQSSFEQEREGYSSQGRQTLAEELQSRHNETTHPDGYSQAPTGLQSSFRKEMSESGRQSLADEILSKTREQPPVDDGYGQSPVGLQQSYEKEHQASSQNERPSLADEILSKLREQPTIDDGYGQYPVGLQSSYKDEVSSTIGSGRTRLEHEISQPVVHEEIDDGYSREPIGLQNTFSSERDDVADSSRLSLEEEIKLREMDAQEANAASDVLSNHETGSDLRGPRKTYDDVKRESKLPSEQVGAKTSGVIAEAINKAKNVFGNASKTAGPGKNNTRSHSTKALYSMQDLIDEIKAIGEEHGLLDSKDFYAIYEKARAQAEFQERLQASERFMTRHVAKTQKENESLGTELNMARGELRSLKARSRQQDESLAEMKVKINTLEKQSVKDESQQQSLKNRLVESEKTIRTLRAEVETARAAAVTKQGQKPERSFKTGSVDTAESALSGTTSALPKVSQETIRLSQVNPIDGTSTRPRTETAAERFASPTGFVNYDPIFPPNERFSSRDAAETRTSDKRRSKWTKRDGLVRRQERVFSGQLRQDRKEKQRRRFEAGRIRLRWMKLRFAFGTATLTAVIFYLVGHLAEVWRVKEEANVRAIALRRASKDDRDY